jgi:hypothetical protein
MRVEGEADLDGMRVLPDVLMRVLAFFEGNTRPGTVTTWGFTVLTTTELDFHGVLESSNGKSLKGIRCFGDLILFSTISAFLNGNEYYNLIKNARAFSSFRQNSFPP